MTKTIPHFILAVFIASLCVVMSAAAQTPGAAPHRSFGLACDLCHTTVAWSTIKNVDSFDHSRTNFGLAGLHKNVSCAGCHKGTGMKSLRTDCISCHTDVHRAEFGTSCQRCHSSEGWRQPMTFISMHEATRFPLLGAHRQLACKGCHANQQKNEYVSVSVECATCHRGEYNMTQNPRHAALRFGLACQECHDVERYAWRPARYNHTHFTLDGAHRSVACSDCHKGSFEGTSVSCVDCHRSDYNNASTPNHAAGNYPTTCANCHTTTSWKPAQVNHTLTGFPLTGGHALQDCFRCHVNGQYAGLSKDCNTCHQKDFTQATNPLHTGKFPTTCATCHTTSSWKPATFDHNATHFALTGAHKQQECAACHKNGQWSGLTTDCYSCHTTDYARVLSPNHATANYPKDCISCHTTTAWKPSTFSHDSKFPIYSGKHRCRWTLCSDCHINPSNFQVYSCIDCHEHNKAEMDSKHKNNKNYSFVSTECYRCHPTGGGG